MTEESRQIVAIIGCVGVPASYGGFETLVEQLIRHNRSHFELHIYCSSRRYPSKQPRYNGAELHYVPLDANGVSSIPYDIFSMIHASTYADVIIVLGVSGCIFLPVLRKISRARVLLNVDGIEWRRDKWSQVAKKFLRFSEGFGVRNSDVVIADNVEIRRYVKENYGVDAACIAYGGDHAVASSVLPSDSESYPFLTRSYAAKVCRIEPENNVHIILEAFSRLKSLPLVVIGNWEDSEYGRRLRAHYEKFDNLYMLDPIYSAEPLNKIRSNARIYVHGHSAGGTNPSLVEAMSLGLAVCAFDVPYNRETTGNRAFYFDTAESLSAILSTLTDTGIAANASSMSSIAKDRYTWSWISDQYSAIIKKG